MFGLASAIDLHRDSELHHALSCHDDCGPYFGNNWKSNGRSCTESIDLPSGSFAALRVGRVSHDAHADGRRVPCSRIAQAPPDQFDACGSCASQCDRISRVRLVNERTVNASGELYADRYGHIWNTDALCDCPGYRAIRLANVSRAN